MTPDEVRAKRSTIRLQLRRVLGGLPPICGCGAQRLWVRLYRCFHCGEWYCFGCAPKHFGPKPPHRVDEPNILIPQPAETWTTRAEGLLQ